MKNSRKRITAIIVCIVAVVAIVAGSLAWYTTTNSLSGFGNLVGFKTTAKVYFQTQDGAQTASPDKNGLYTLSLDSSDDNYIGNLRLNVIHKGYGKSYVRVKMSVQWTMPDGTVTQNVVLPYKFANDWYDNRGEDYCVYYTKSSGLFDSYDKSIITGFDADSFNSETLTTSATAKVSITVESVQANRYRQIWQIDSLPWE